jgi:hypothetical protein
MCRVDISAFIQEHFPRWKIFNQWVLRVATRTLNRQDKRTIYDWLFENKKYCDNLETKPVPLDIWIMRTVLQSPNMIRLINSRRYTRELFIEIMADMHQQCFVKAIFEGSMTIDEIHKIYADESVEITRSNSADSS